MTLTLTENQTRWLAALRSGEFKQGQNALRTCKDEFCCLGVASELFKPEGFEPDPVGDVYAYDRSTTCAPDYVVHALGLNDFLGATRPLSRQSLASLNDRGRSFAEIADLIEANPEDYFRDA